MTPVNEALLRAYARNLGRRHPAGMRRGVSKAPGGVTAPTPPSSGLLAWLDPADLTSITKDGSDKVSAYAAKAGSIGGTLTQGGGAAQFTWEAAGLDGAACLLGAGAQYMEGMDTLALTFKASNYDLIVVQEKAAAGEPTSNYSTLFGAGSVASSAERVNHRRHQATSSGVDRSFRSPSATLTGTQTLEGTVKAARFNWASTGTLTSTVNGVASASGAFSGTIGAIDRCYLGVERFNAAFNSYYYGRIGQIFMYDHALDAGEFSQLYAYLQSIYPSLP